MNLRRRQRYLRILRKYENEDTECNSCEEGTCPNCEARKTLQRVDNIIKDAVKRIGRIESERSADEDRSTEKRRRSKVQRVRKLDETDNSSQTASDSEEFS